MKTILTVKQVAELLQVSIPQVRRMIANGELSAMKVRPGVARAEGSARRAVRAGAAVTGVVRVVADDNEKQAFYKSSE